MSKSPSFMDDLSQAVGNATDFKCFQLLNDYVIKNKHLVLSFKSSVVLRSYHFFNPVEYLEFCSSDFLTTY
jgi:hypothetical protein